jgi:maleate isomerase
MLGAGNGEERMVAMTQKDNWGWQARIGMFIVGNEAVPEAEWWAMLPSNVSVHAARVTARAPWARWRDDRSGVELEEDLARGCRQFAAMRLSVVVVGHSSSSILGGEGWDEAVVTELSAILGAGTRVTTNGLDCVAALRASGVRRQCPRHRSPWHSQWRGRIRSRLMRSARHPTSQSRY